MNIALLVFLITFTQAAPRQCAEPERLDALVSDSKVVALVEVAEVEGTGPMFWSGNGLAIQHVTYRVKKVLKGTLDGDTMRAAHPLYQGSFSADRETPRLSPRLFRRGNTLLLFVATVKQPIKEGDGTYREVEELMTTDVECGAIVPNEHLIRSVSKILARERGRAALRH